jgi:predicted DNA-binding transcriptional regulator AlpA
MTGNSTRFQPPVETTASDSEPFQRGRLRSEPDAARYCAVSTRTLQQYRLTGAGPVYVQIGSRRIGYRLADLDAWLDARRRRSTTDQGEAA